MKKSKIYILLAAVLISIAFSSCMQNKKTATPITQIPVTTQSKEAADAFRQGLAMSDQGDRQKSRALYTSAIELDPKLAIAYVYRAGSSNTTQDFVNDMNQAKANLTGVSNWEKWYYDFMATFLTGDWNKRLEIAKTIADSFPDAARPQVDLGQTYSNGNQESQARECYQKAIELDSSWVGGYAFYATSYLFSEPKDFKKAEEYALKEVALAPQSPGAEITLGDCYRAENDLVKARDAYAKAITLDPNSSEAYYKEGHANTFLGNYDEARKNYVDGDKHNQELIASSAEIAYTYLYAGDPKTAFNALMADVHRADSSTESKNKIEGEKLNYLTDCEQIAMHTGDVAGLKNLLAMTGPLNADLANSIGTPEATQQNQANDLYWQSIVAAMEGNYDEATSKAEQMKTTLQSINDPNKLDQYHFALGYIAMKEKKYSDAVGHFAETNQNSIYNNYWLAMANEAAGNKDKADALYKSIAIYNFNSVDYALIRSEVLKKVTPAT